MYIYSARDYATITRDGEALLARGLAALPASGSTGPGNRLNIFNPCPHARTELCEVPPTLGAEDAGALTMQSTVRKEKS